jgi:hypothetical protein
MLTVHLLDLQARLRDGLDELAGPQGRLARRAGEAGDLAEEVEGLGEQLARMRDAERAGTATE